MRFMVIVHPENAAEYEAGAMPDMQMLARMGKFNEELVDAGVMRAGEGLHPTSKGVRIHFSDGGKMTVTEGPFPLTDELVGGFWIWEVKSKEEALSWAKRAPMPDSATLEIRQIFEAADFGVESEAYDNALKGKMANSGS